MPALVMIVDDHAIIRRMVREVFEAEDLEVFDAANGAEGVQKAQDVKSGLMILDLSMPVMNGLDAARELKVVMPYVPLLEATARSRESTPWLGRGGCSTGFLTGACSAAKYVKYGDAARNK